MEKNVKISKKLHKEFDGKQYKKNANNSLDKLSA